jgi:hypothetical protein
VNNRSWHTPPGSPPPAPDVREKKGRRNWRAFGLYMLGVLAFMVAFFWYGASRQEKIRKENAEEADRERIKAAEKVLRELKGSGD